MKMKMKSLIHFILINAPDSWGVDKSRTYKYYLLQEYFESCLTIYLQTGDVKEAKANGKSDDAPSDDKDEDAKEDSKTDAKKVSSSFWSQWLKQQRYSNLHT